MHIKHTVFTPIFALFGSIFLSAPFTRCPQRCPLLVPPELTRFELHGWHCVATVAPLSVRNTLLLSLMVLLALLRCILRCEQLLAESLSASRFVLVVRGSR